MKAKVMDQRTKIIFAKVNLVETPTADVIINQKRVTCRTYKATNGAKNTN